MSAEAGLEFIDTNILVYAHDLSAGAKRERALAVVEGLVRERRAALSVQVLQEFFVTVTAKIVGRLPVAEAAAAIADLAVLRTHAPNTADVLAAIDMHGRLSVSFWDAMVLRSASQLGCAVVWSEDLSHGGVYDGVTVLNPFAPA